jgi:ABC-2 type transport system permease protein
MNKVSVIIKREYLTRVRKKSFVIMTILAPLLMAALIILPTAIMMNDKGEHKKIAVVEDKSDLFSNVLKDTKDINFVYINNRTVDDLKASLDTSGYYGILWISPQVVNTPNAVQLISKKQPPIGLLQYIENSLKK